MADRAADLRSWVLRTVGANGASVREVRDHFTVQYPDRDAADLEDILENQRDIVANQEEGRVSLTDEARHELEQLGKEEYSRRVRGDK